MDTDRAVHLAWNFVNNGFVVGCSVYQYFRLQMHRRTMQELRFMTKDM